MYLGSKKPGLFWGVVQPAAICKHNAHMTGFKNDTCFVWYKLCAA